ncbi:long-chain fatty acid--CoA ligase [Solirubrobacter sp. CPCC 204708]|uniref:Acyl-CoA synthetase n=1 Tax=Solirubrobacter deserti TaxID=2282478 RepID=A0ABT4RSJ9_9ACTN|nr:AMP-dependent synthetase/ligase [Solirubrobacter deserti]MBE2315120.1 long-chain fatty acid--CoA ligase [Solirubrobacter deserti]MDA0141358.1 AMP-dependent synthetase/ligase [Solirubrobacter deserti]
MGERRAVHAATIAEAFRLTVEDNADRIAVRTAGDEIAWTWAELEAKVDAFAGGLAKLGVTRGDTVALMISNRPEFMVADLAATMLGATPFSIYLTSAPDQIAYVIKDAAARVAIVEAPFKDAVAPLVEYVLTVEEMDGYAVPGFQPDWRAVQPDDILTIIYTSGTTGPPKGVQLSHANEMAAVDAVEKRVGFPDGSRIISWLPSAHVAERTAHHYLPIVYGMTITTCPDPRRIGEFLPLVKPTWFFAVPRVWEKLKAGIETKLAGNEQAEKVLTAAKQVVELRQAGEPVPDALESAVELGEEQLFGPLRAAIGLDEARLVNVGAAPTPREVLVFFHAIGVPLAEIWGMSETCGAGASNPEERIKIGTVGLPSPGVELKLAEDGELLARSKVVMVGYRNLPDKTAEALDEEGWLHTGDVATIDEDGYVTIIDRKKELIINAAGKNMSPANIEAALKGASPLIGQACVVGDGRPYNVALIVLDPDYAAAVEDHAAVVAEAVEAANSGLSRPEQIKRWTILNDDWVPGGDELTPTMKLKRRPIMDKFAGEIDAMYQG